MLFLFACSSNKQLQYNTSNCNFNDKIFEEEKVLNFKIIRDRFKENGYYVYEDNDSIHYSLDYGVDNEYWKRRQNKINEIEKIIAYDTITLKLKSLFFRYNKGNFYIGNKYIYNEKGEVIQTIDHNQYGKYPICYKEIIKSTIKKAGSKFYFQGLERDSILSNDQKTYSWKVYFEDSITKYPGLRHKFFRIDAKTGKTIVEEIVD